ncbi:MAG: hypothetical protein II917_10030, partial [Synergistaceae bacterium]|nr:hypothetical protein [Synergistaceae bacterium]
MKRKFLSTLALSLVISFICHVGGAFASTVKVKDKYLSDISDIVKTASGRELEIQKHSIMLFERFGGGYSSTVHFQPRIFTVNSDGSLKAQYTLSDYTIKKSVIDPTDKIVQKIELAVSDKRFGEGSRNLMITSPGFTDNSGLYGVRAIKSQIKSNKVTLTNVDTSYNTTNANQANLWGTGCLEIKGINKDVFVYVSSPAIGLYRSGSVLFSFVTADRSEDGKVNLQNLKVNNNGLKDQFEVLNYNRGLNGVGIATGDIDNDGYKNEIALFINRSPYGYSYDSIAYIYSVSSPDGKNLKLNLIKSQSVYERTYTSDIQVNPNALVGDFDGDGRNEAAFVDRLPEVNVRVGILKFNEAGKWQYDYTDYDYEHDYRNLSNIGPMKAVKYDLDGDWKDEIAILSLPVEKKFGNMGYQSFVSPTLEIWGCSNGIKPSRLYNRGVLPSISDSDTIAEQFSITAGPLTGRLGKAKLVDDVAISHVDSSGSRVYVVPTNLSPNHDYFAGFG